MKGPDLGQGEIEEGYGGEGAIEKLRKKEGVQACSLGQASLLNWSQPFCPTGLQEEGGREERGKF